MNAPWRGAIAFLVCATGLYAEASTEIPRPDPELEVIAGMRDRFESACKSGVQSTNARHRPQPVFIEYAYVDCTPFKDAHGTL